MSIRITCINKSGGFHQDAHHAISDLGWVEDGTGKHGRSTRLEVYEWLKYRNGVAYVRDTRGHQTAVLPREHANGTEFVQTVADRIWSDNLLALPECIY
jgi:hypothetical protein